MILTTFLTTLLLYVAVGLWATRKVQNTDDFVVMGSSAPTLLVVGTLAATYLSAVTILGIAGLAYSEGPLVVSTLGSTGAWIGTMLAVLYVGRRFKAMDCKTMPEFFEKRFQSKAVSTMATLIMIASMLGYGVAQLIGAGLVVSEITSLSFTSVILLFVATLLALSAMGGMYAVVVTDTLMFFAMLGLSLLVAPMIIAEAGLSNVKSLSAMLPGYWTIAGTESRPLAFGVSQLWIWIIFFTCTPTLVSRVFPAKNDFVLLKAGMIGVFLAALLQVPVYLAASSMRAIDPNITPSDKVMIVAFTEQLHPMLGGVGLAALIAAILSTASTLFVVCGLGMSRDLCRSFSRETISERKLMLVDRWAQAIVAAIVATIAICKPAAIYWVSVFAGAIFGVGWLPSIVAGLEWRRVTHYAAASSMFAGVTTLTALSRPAFKEWIGVGSDFDPVFVSFLISTVTLLIVTWLSKPQPDMLSYYDQSRAVRLSDQTIRETISRPNGLSQLKQEFYSVVWTGIAVLVSAALVWGSFAWLFSL